ncbi:MAG: acylphosphatase [DPANN group archaeon]|nr:acylphosphatase [DPANN group archaeon]
MVKKRLHLIIKGLVQGVFYRTSARDIAANLMCNGWVKNLPNGDVELVAEGDEKDLKDLLKWAKHGPEQAVIETVKEKWSASKDAFDDFEIIEDSIKDAESKAAELKKINKLLEVDEGSDHPVHEPLTKEDTPFKQ